MAAVRYTSIVWTDDHRLLQ